MNPSRWLRTALGLVYPACCAGCGSRLPETPQPTLCDPCHAGLRPIRPPFCCTCGEMYPTGQSPASFRCSNCAGLDPSFEFAIAPFENAGTLRPLIHRFKYGRTLHLRGILGHLLTTVLDDPRIAAGGGPNGWLLVPVPLHPLRFIWRGFNQADELARQVARLGGLRRSNALRRVRFTSSQANLDRRHRMANLSQAFTVSRRVRSLECEHVLLVDDVFTTGSTTAACARALTEDGGAEKVAVITLARG